MFHILAKIIYPRVSLMQTTLLTYFITALMNSETLDTQYILKLIKSRRSVYIYLDRKHPSFYLAISYFHKFGIWQLTKKRQSRREQFLLLSMIVRRLRKLYYV